jgi:hypothetical protein
MAKSLREQYVEALLKKGYQQIESRSGKYLMFKTADVNKFYYVGKSGSLRIGTTIKDSIPVSNHFKRFLLITMDQQSIPV